MTILSMVSRMEEGEIVTRQLNVINFLVQLFIGIQFICLVLMVLSRRILTNAVN